MCRVSFHVHDDDATDDEEKADRIECRQQLTVDEYADQAGGDGPETGPDAIRDAERDRLQDDAHQRERDGETSEQHEARDEVREAVGQL